MPSLAPVKSAFWRVARPTARRELRARVDRLAPGGPKHWYYHLDFGYGVEVRPDLRKDRHAGEANWRFLHAHLPDLRGKRVLDVGSNAGLYALRMADAGAAEVVGVEFDTAQAEFTRERFAARNGRDYSNVRFVAGDARELDLRSLGRFDLASAFCVLYHLAEGADKVISTFADVSDTVALQGNLPRVTGEKYRERTHQELAGIEGMRGMLEAHGLTEIEVVAPPGHPKPLVIGRAPAG